MDIHDTYMHRCLQLAAAANGFTAPNPIVGAVLVHNGRIIGEGYHEAYGQAHAEVNCIASVKADDRPFIRESVLYVSLEPCAHHGKTPPCADLIIAHQVPEVFVGIRDPFKEVNGRGMEKLKAAGVKVTAGILQDRCRELNKRFFTFHTMQRPYILLKWAQSLNGKIANEDRSRVMISNALSNRLVHKWRSQEQSIMIGANTALYDDPSLTTRLWEGKNPVRIIIDPGLRLPPSLNVLDSNVPTIVFNTEREEEIANLRYYRLEKNESFIHQVMQALHRLSIQSVLVEGGAGLLRSLIEENLWDEARVITNTGLMIPGGLAAPELLNAIPAGNDTVINDEIYYYINKTV